LRLLLGSLLGSLRDLAPIIVVIGFFQLVVVGEPIPNLGTFLVGFALVTLGLTFFVRGLNMGLFPLGESMAYDFARKGSVGWLLLFAFALGFGTTVAEPALIAVAGEAAQVAADAGVLAADEESIRRYAFGLRVTVALSVGFAVLVGVYRILRGWPIHYLIIGGYLGVVLWDVPCTAEWHKSKRCVIRGQSQHLLDFGIIERSHQHRRKTSGGGLKVHILRCVSDLDVDVPTAPFAVLPLRTLIHACKSKYGRRTADPRLAEGCGS